jgi:hypothetical protein
MSRSINESVTGEGIMTAEKTLIRFLCKVLQKRWQDRYVSILQTRRGKKTFLDDLWHQLKDRFDPEKVMTDLPEEAWSSPGFSFSQHKGFGKEEKSVRTAFDTVGEGSLIIDKTGTYGAYQPEDMVDEITYLHI